MTFADYCLKGEEADQLYIQGNFPEAEEKYLEILGEIRKGKEIDIFLISKAVLGLMLTYLKQGELQKALDVWIADPNESLYGLGTMGLGETLQTSVHDTMTYMTACAYLSSFSTEEPPVAGKRVNYYMKTVAEYAIEKEPDLWPIVFSNWKKNLIEVFGIFIPESFSAEISHYERKTGMTFPLLDIDFPKPNKWVINWHASERKITPQ